MRLLFCSRKGDRQKTTKVTTILTMDGKAFDNYLGGVLQVSYSNWVRVENVSDSSSYCLLFSR